MAAANKIQVGYIEPQDGAQFKVDEGTAAAPGICFVDSAGTGSYSPGTGQIAWSTSGKQTALRILADGKVGIDCSPTVALEVNGTIKASAIDAPIEGTLDDWIVHAGDTNTKIGFPDVDQFQIQTGGTGRVTVTDSTTTVDNDLRVIKTSGPLLELNTNGNTADATLRLSEGATGTTNNGGGMYYSGADNKLYITCGANLTTKRITIQRDDGFIGINKTDPKTGLTINQFGTQPVVNGNTYPYPAGNWSTVWNTETANSTDYWAGFVGSYNVSSATVNISLAPNTFNFSTQQGIYIAGEAQSTSTADFTIGKLIGGSQGGASASARNQRATKSELFRIKSDGKVGIGTDAPSEDLEVKGDQTSTIYINAGQHDTNTANEATLKFGYNQSHANDSIGYVKLIELANNTFDGALSFGVPYNNSGTPATREALRIDSNGMSKFTRGSTGTVGHFYANARECNILLQNDAQTWKIVNYDYGNNGTDNLGFHDGTADRLVIAKTGKIGINNTNPDYTLDVRAPSGDVWVSARGGTNQGYQVRKSDNTLIGYAGNGGGVNLGVNDFALSAPAGNLILQTGGTAASNERLRIDSSGVLFHKPSGATSSAYLKAENTSTTYFLKAQKDGAVDTNLSLNVQDGGSLKTLLYLRGDNKTVAVGPDITPYRNLHVQEHFLVANKGTNSDQPYVSSIPILAVGTDGQNVVPSDATYRHNALVLFGVGGHNAGNPAANSYSGLCPALGYFKLDLYGQTGLGDVGSNLDSTLSIRSINPNNTRFRIRTKDNYNGTYPHASISFTQQQSTEIGRIECLSRTSAANRAHLDFHTNWGGLARRMRIMDTGKILYGNHLYDRGGELQYEGSEHVGIGIHRNTANHGAPSLRFSASRGTSSGATTIVQNNDYLGMINFSGADGSDLASSAYITGIVDGTPASNAIPGRLQFWTSGEDSNGPREGLRITKYGSIIGATTGVREREELKPNTTSMPKWIEGYSVSGTTLSVAASMFHQTHVRGTSNLTTELFSTKMGGNGGMYIQVEVWFSCAVSNYQGYQMLWANVHRTSWNNFTINNTGQEGNKLGSDTTGYFTLTYNSSGSGGSQRLTWKVVTSFGNNYVRCLYKTTCVGHDYFQEFNIIR